jgi:hypothetical protein
VIHVQIAVVASWLPPVGGNDLERPYADRLKVVLDVAPGETLGDVYRRTVEHLSPRAIEGSDGYVDDPMDVVHWAWFFEPEDEQGISDTKVWEVAEQLTTVDPQGRAVWRRRADDIPYEDIVRVGEAGVLRGDPLRPYLVLLLPQGPDLIQTAWHDLLLVWGHVGDLLTARELVKIASTRRERLARVRPAADVVAKYSGEWARRGGAPLEVKRMLERRPWPPDELRMLLGGLECRRGDRATRGVRLSASAERRLRLERRRRAAALGAGGRRGKSQPPVTRRPSVEGPRAGRASARNRRSASMVAVLMASHELSDAEPRLRVFVSSAIADPESPRCAASTWNRGTPRTRPGAPRS